MLRVRDTRAWAVGLWLLLVSLGAGAQPAPELTWADGEAAFDLVEDWVRSEQGVPDDAGLPDRPVAGLFGVYVTLRDSGRVLGRGQALRQDVAQTIDQPGPAVGMAELLAAATRQALDELRDKQMQRAIDLGIADPELFEQALIETRQRVQVDVQLGHKLESIILPLDGDDAAVFARFAPGFHGLRIAGPLAGRADYAWPATELSRNTSPLRLMRRLLDQQGYSADDLPIVARGDGPALQRFEVIHMVRPAQAQPMRQLVRGNLIVPQQVVDGQTIGGLAERAARYLDQLVVRNEEDLSFRVRGAYQPSMQRYAPAWASPREVALLGYALNRYAAIAIDAEIAGEAMRARARRVLRLIEQLEPDALPAGRPPQHLTAAFMLMALVESPVELDDDAIALRDRLGRTLLDLRHPEGGYRVEAGSDTRLNRASASVLTASLAAWTTQSDDAEHAAAAWAALDELMQANTRSPRVADLVWVSHAISKAGPALAAGQDDPAAAAQQLDAWRTALADFLELLSEQQVRAKPILGPEDVTGGFILQPAPPGSPPNPTWQSAMPLTVMALGLRDPAIIDPQRNFGPLLAAGLGARFLGQLMITAPNAYYLRDPQPALGGIRNTLWDNTLYPDCSAMALIALAELQQTLIILNPEDDG